MIDRLRSEPERLAGWVALAVWVAQPFTLGPLLGDALDPTRQLFRSAASWALWVWWVEVLIALVVPRPLMLTIVRIGGLAAVPAAIWAAIETDDNTRIAVGLISAASAATILLLPVLADHFIDGISYGEERRFVLRPPGPVLVGLVVPSWAVAVSGLVAGPLLLADEQWVLGGVLVVVGLPLSVLAARALHQLTNRFLVFVPNGLVVHDLTVMGEPLLFRSADIAGLAPALADTDADDMTNSALGLALELRLSEPVKIVVAVSRGEIEERETRAMLISPSRPAAVMRVAIQRGLRIV
jgi:hypothetical protein